MYVTFNQKIYVYWEVQLERMESTNLLKVLEAQPEFRELLGELGVGEPRDWRGCWESWVWVSPGACGCRLPVAQVPADPPASVSPSDPDELSATRALLHQTLYHPDQPPQCAPAGPQDLGSLV